MKLLRLYTVGAAMAMTLLASAVPAKRTTFTAVQPDGSEITLTRAGDEFFKFFVTDDNQVVVGNETDGYFFATVDETSGRVVASDVMAADASSRNAVQSAFVSAINRDKICNAIDTSRSLSPIAYHETDRRLAPVQSGVGLTPGVNYPKNGSPKGLIILVQYSDVKFNTSYDAGDYFERMINEKGFKDYNATGSALDWFTDASFGNFTPDFDVYGPVTLPNPQAYYGGNDSYGNDLHPEKMVIDGCTLLDSQINFKDYDTDGNGYVDNVFVFYAGRGEADGGGANTVWPHQWEIPSSSGKLVLDGVTISRYACTNEWSNNGPAGIGTFCHEFSHVMGLPDLYHTAAMVYYTPGQWSVLDYGPYLNNGRTPPTYSIFERNAMGWIDPLVLDQTPRTVELSHIESSNYGCLIPTSSKNEFFLLENRQKTGWDTYVPGHGMLIWHIDYNQSAWRYNSVNNDQSHQYVDIEEANNNPNSSSVTISRNWAFPGTSGAYTSFTDDTRPSMKTWDGSALNIPITNITEKNGIITFDVCGGAPLIGSPIAFQPEPDQIGTNSFTASWSEVENAIDYLITVYAIKDDGTATTADINTFGSGETLIHAPGWSSSNSNGIYTGSGEYGNSAPSLKMSMAGHYLETPVYKYSINDISFWASAIGLTPANTATLYAVDGDNLTELTTFTDWSLNSGEVVKYTLPTSDVFKLRLTYNKEKGGTNLAIDDFTVNYTAPSKAPLPDFTDISTSGATSILIEGLENGKIYYFSVVAVDDEGNVSSKSNEVEVDLSISGVEDIYIDNNAPVEYFNLQGIRVNNPVNGIYLRRQGSHVEKVIR